MVSRLTVSTDNILAQMKTRRGLSSLALLCSNFKTYGNIPTDRAWNKTDKILKYVSKFFVNLYKGNHSFFNMMLKHHHMIYSRHIGLQGVSHYFYWQKKQMCILELKNLPRRIYELPVIPGFDVRSVNVWSLFLTTKDIIKQFEPAHEFMVLVT